MDKQTAIDDIRNKYKLGRIKISLPSFVMGQWGMGQAGSLGGVGGVGERFLPHPPTLPTPPLLPHLLISPLSTPQSPSPHSHKP